MTRARLSLCLYLVGGQWTLHISLSRSLLEACQWSSSTTLELEWGEGRFYLVESPGGNKLRLHTASSGAYWRRIIFPQERGRLLRRYGAKGTGFKLTWTEGLYYKKYTYQGTAKSFLGVKGKPVLGSKRQKTTKNIGSFGGMA